MNRGLAGLPHRPGRRSRVDRIDALAGAIGTPIMRTTGYAGPHESGAAPVQLAAIKATAGLSSIAYSPVDDCLYACANTTDGQVVVVSPASQRVIRRFHVGANPISLAFASTIARLLILRTDGTLVVYDPVRRAIVRSVATGVASATRVVFAPSDGVAYVVGSVSAGAAINLSTWAVTAFVIPVGALDAVFSPIENTIMLACTGGIGSYDLKLQTSLGIIHASTVQMDHIGISPSSAYVMAVSRSGSAKYLYTQATADVAVEQTNVPGSVLGAIAYSPRTRLLYVGDSSVGALRMFDVPRFTLATWGCALSCGLPRALAFCPSDGRMYAVSDAGASEIAVIS